MDNITRKKHTGEPGNAGQFGTVVRPEADASLTGAGAVQNPFTVAARAAIAEGATYRDIVDDLDGYQTSYPGADTLQDATDMFDAAVWTGPDKHRAQEVFGRLAAINGDGAPHNTDDDEWRRALLAQLVQQVNSKWQVAAALTSGGPRTSVAGDATILVGPDIMAGEAQLFAAFRFPAGWRCSALVRADLPHQVKQRALAAMRALP